MSIQRIYCVPKKGLCTKPGICDRRLCHMPPEKQYQPDLHIEHTKVSYSLSPLGWCLAVFSVLMLVIAALRNA